MYTALSLESSSGNKWKMPTQQWHYAIKAQCTHKYWHRHKRLIYNPWYIPSCGTLEFLVLSLSSDVSLLTALPLLVLRRTLNARFSLLNERLLTEERSKFLTAKKTGEKERHFIDELTLNMPRHAWICLVIANQTASSWFNGYLDWK